MADISLRNITKRFGATTILENISLDIKDREFFCITGPSGSGKTTLLRIIAGLDNDFEGNVFFNGKNITAQSPSERNIAMVFQDYALYPNMVARENISFPLRVKNYSRENLAKKVGSTVKQIDIRVDKYLDFFPRQLSAGHKQRVATGRAIIRDNPNAFLLDEPLSNLDAKIRMNTCTYLKRLVADIKSTTVYITSDSNEALALADRLAVLENKKFLQVDRPFDMYFNPKNTFVADFFGILGMNFISGNINKGGFIFDSKRLDIPAYIGNSFKRLEGKEVLLGIRPEEIDFFQEPAADRIDSTIELIQSFPPRANMVCKIGPVELNIVSFIKNIEGVKAGSTIYISMDRTKTYLFDKDSGNIIT
jgi:multiple sugar transport system ATP-binding protein